MENVGGQIAQCRRHGHAAEERRPCRHWKGDRVAIRAPRTMSADPSPESLNANLTPFVSVLREGFAGFLRGWAEGAGLECVAWDHTS